jgi:hypothetical protein
MSEEAAEGVIVDALWNRYRTLAHDTLVTTQSNEDEAKKQSMEGVLSLFVANCIARWVDRIEREPDGVRRQEMVHVLLGE